MTARWEEPYPPWWKFYSSFARKPAIVLASRQRIFMAD